MTSKVKFFAIKSYEWLLPTGDASKILVNYSIADDDQVGQNARDYSIVIKFARSAQRGAFPNNDNNKAKVIIAYLREEIRKAIISESELLSELTITSYDKGIPTNPEVIELRLGEWEKVIIERKMGFLLT
jgi:hypothetical protein